MDKYHKDPDALCKEAYRPQSNRLKGYDYATEGTYFITICTYHRESYFGEIQNGIMGLNQLGCLAAQFWQDIPSHFNDVNLDTWVVMPNHVHGILILGHLPNINDQQNHKSQRRPQSQRRDAINRVSTAAGHGGITGKYNPIGKGTIGEIIRWYKGRTTFEIRKNHTFGWQPRFHDHIIRDENELNRIRKYILQNPLKWELNKDNPKNFRK